MQEHIGAVSELVDRPCKRQPGKPFVPDLLQASLNEAAGHQHRERPRMIGEDRRIDLLGDAQAVVSGGHPCIACHESGLAGVMVSR